MTTRSIAALSLIGFLCGCTGNPTVLPEDLEVVAAPLVEEEPVLPRYLLVARHQPAEGDAEFASLELWVPLPPAGGGQRVGSLIYEVAPPAKLEGTFTSESGDRLLHIRSQGTFPQVLVRAMVDRTGTPSTDLPKALNDLGPGLDAPAWVKAAVECGEVARLAYGVEVRSDGSASPCRIPELEVDRRWLPVDLSTQRTGLPEGTLRMGGTPARAEADGQPLPLVTNYSVTVE